MNKERVLIIHEDAGSISALAKALESLEYEVVIAPDTEISISQPSLHRYSIILLSSRIRTVTPVEFITTLRSNPLNMIVPVILLVAGEGTAGSTWKRLADGADSVIPINYAPEEIASLTDSLLRRRAAQEKDPVTGLITGAPMNRILSSLCSSNKFGWYFMAIKILGLQSFNLGYGYEAGDKLMKDVGELLDGISREQGEESDFAGRLGGPVFCMVSRTRRIDSLCRNILVKSERMIRKYYSPFELMKGYMTIEEGGKSENYYLSELNIAVLQMPSRWDGHVSYMVDIATELLELVKREESGYRVISP